MEQTERGLSQQQQNDCRAALQKFIDRHELSNWEMTVKVQETATGEYGVKIQVTPPPSSGLPAWPFQEIAVTDTSFDVAAELDHLLELGYSARLPGANTL
jgi:hypothetical protein